DSTFHKNYSTLAYGRATKRIDTMPTLHERIAGGLWGLLVGDALGVPYEFHQPHDLPPRHQLEMRPPTSFRRAHARVPLGPGPMMALKRSPSWPHCLTEASSTSMILASAFLPGTSTAILPLITK